MKLPHEMFFPKRSEHTQIIALFILLSSLPFVFLICGIFPSSGFRQTVTFVAVISLFGYLLFLFLRSRRISLSLGLLFILPIILAASLSFADYGFFKDHSAVARFGETLGPSKDFILGTDYEGRDIFATLVMGGMNAYLVALITMITALLVGIPAGVLLSAKNPLLKKAAEWTTQFFEIIPQLFFVLIVMGVYNFWAASAAGTRLVSWYSVPLAGIAIGLSSLPNIARVLENRVKILQGQRFVTALKSANVSNKKILLYNILLKNCMAEILVQATFMFGSALLLESALSYAFEIGFGDLGTGGYLSWGKVLAEARRSILFGVNLWIIIPPIFVIIISILGINTIGDSLAKLLRN